MNLQSSLSSSPSSSSSMSLFVLHCISSPYLILYPTIPSHLIQGSFLSISQSIIFIIASLATSLQTIDVFSSPPPWHSFYMKE
ncbi:hypothetical protein BYT27DRAFT_6871494 [Phlegmacium glaucopus]|nr:hypothetical protein BYT27DRAFT_6871494 [Phlegmacium glaucopus]